MYKWCDGMRRDSAGRRSQVDIFTLTLVSRLTYGVPALESVVTIASTVTDRARFIHGTSKQSRGASGLLGAELDAFERRCRGSGENKISCRRRHQNGRHQHVLARHQEGFFR